MQHLEPRNDLMQENSQGRDDAGVDRTGSGRGEGKRLIQRDLKVGFGIHVAELRAALLGVSGCVIRYGLGF